MKHGLHCLLLLWVALASPLAACQCGRRTLEQALAETDAVFEGQLVERWPVLVEEPPFGSLKFPALRYRFRVLRVWKGEATAEVALVDQSGNCSYHFDRHGSYGVFARVVQGSKYLSTTFCLPTKPVERAGSELQFLGPGRVMQKVLHGMEETSFHRLGRAAMAAALCGWFWPHYLWTEVREGEAGAWYLLLFRLTVVLLSGAGLWLVIRGRWKPVLLGLVTGLLAVTALLFSLGGWILASNAMVAYLAK